MPVVRLYYMSCDCQITNLGCQKLVFAAHSSHWAYYCASWGWECWRVLTSIISNLSFVLCLTWPKEPWILIPVSFEYNKTVYRGHRMPPVGILAPPLLPLLNIHVKSFMKLSNSFKKRRKKSMYSSYPSYPGNRKTVLVENQIPDFKFPGIVCCFCKRFPHQFQSGPMMSPRTLHSNIIILLFFWLARNMVLNARKSVHILQKRITTG